MMFAHRINMLTHELKHQCKIADVSQYNASVDKHSNMASSAAIVAPYLQGILVVFGLVTCSV